MPLLNSFKLGADPEFIVIRDGHMQLLTDTYTDRYAPWGLDHSGWVIEPHPKPDLSVRKLVDNLKVAMNDFATVAPSGKWRAGAYWNGPERSISLGGHVHVDKPKPTAEETAALDHFNQYLEKLDILPSRECVSRRDAGGYGRLSDTRVEHGHFEYRTFPSWLFSQRVTKLCTLGTKLIMCNPKSIEPLGPVATASMTKFRSFYEQFKGKDDDADWIVNSGMLRRRLNIDPDKDLRDVWKVKPVKEDPRWKREQAAQAPSRQLNPPSSRIVRDRTVLENPCVRIGSYVVYLSGGVHRVPTLFETNEIRRRLSHNDCYGGSRYSAGDQSFFVVSGDGTRFECAWWEGYVDIGPRSQLVQILNSQRNWEGIPRVIARAVADERSMRTLQVSEEGLAYILQ